MSELSIPDPLTEHDTIVTPSKNPWGDGTTKLPTAPHIRGHVLYFDRVTLLQSSPPSMNRYAIRDFVDVLDSVPMAIAKNSKESRREEFEGNKVEFLWSSGEINLRIHEYWPLVMDIA
ncbi:hypothetical protein OSB04_015088 [Centaurea solstitialis]|uniref:Uncharacterized protein n=1 Tax=Centaurea solstitialis TaxID=347529 RepID=A0AA38T654_9ASTR|nr:hypothetical protein OSB04_015088 [Centaurea solstitialis]